MEGYIKDTIFKTYGLFNVLGYEESDNRSYLTFTCGSGIFIAVLAKYSNEVTFYKYEKRRIIENED